MVSQEFIEEVRVIYEKYRLKWITKFDTDEGFNEWFVGKFFNVDLLNADLL